MLFLLPLGLLSCSPSKVPEPQTDVVIYGGTAGGVAAAIQADRMGKSVILIETTDRLGGLTTGGLGQTDIGNKMVIGGIAREFYRGIRDYYADPAHWKWQTFQEYRDEGQSRTLPGEDAMWTFEPSAALSVLARMLSGTKVSVLYNERLNRESGVVKEGDRLISLTTESGKTIRGRMFIDATYEGDLMAAAGVDYMVGRESVSAYGESLNGVQTAQNRYHNFVPGVDPYRIAGVPGSGLLPFIDENGPGQETSADRRVQAYCFRMCLTDHPDNRIPFAKPEGYDESWYELLLRNFEAGENRIPWINSPMPNRKTDTNNFGGFSTDFIGQNYSYPEAGYAERGGIREQHLQYQKGLMWTLANHPRVPEKIRAEVSRWGTCKDEFERGEGWQEQLYIREARRMVGEYVMTQRNCEGQETVQDVVGFGAYGMDSHNVQRYVDSEGHVRNEGDVEVSVPHPYPISYRALLPKKGQVSNLLVPVCLSATHIAFGSIRMEPVFMVLGQSAATAAGLAIDFNVATHDLSYDSLRSRLLTDRQILAFEATEQGESSAK